jgi:hypothetical protein
LLRIVTAKERELCFDGGGMKNNQRNAIGIGGDAGRRTRHIPACQPAPAGFYCKKTAD